MEKNDKVKSKKPNDYLLRYALFAFGGWALFGIIFSSSKGHGYQMLDLTCYLYLSILTIVYLAIGYKNLPVRNFPYYIIVLIVLAVIAFNFASSLT